MERAMATRFGVKYLSLVKSHGRQQNTFFNGYIDNIHIRGPEDGGFEGIFLITKRGETSVPKFQKAFDEHECFLKIHAAS